MIFVTEEAIKISKDSSKDKISDKYVLETTFSENGKTYELWHDPKSTDQKLTYIKKEVSN